MATLLLRLAGAMQSWGAESKFDTRRTMDFPTKSGVIGLLASSLGMSRNAPLDRLNRLKFGVRIDKEGVLLRDYQIAKGTEEKSVYLTYRYYLADAVFLAGLESDDMPFLEELATALRNPAFPPYLGKRSCPPTMPLLLGIRQTDLLSTLQNEPWLVKEWQQSSVSPMLRIITDGDNSQTDSVLRDVPLSFDKVHRQFTWRTVQEHGYVEMKQAEVSTEHDAFKELR